MNEMSEFVKLSEYSSYFGDKTATVFKTHTESSRYMVLFCRIEDDFDEAKFFDDIEEAQNSSEDWVQ